MSEQSENFRDVALKEQDRDLDRWIAAEADRLGVRPRAKPSPPVTVSAAESTLAAIPEAVLRFDAEGRLTSWNPAASALLSLTPETSRGRPFAEVLTLLRDVDHRPIADPVSRCMELQEVIESDEQTLLAMEDDREIYTLFSAAPVRSSSGEVEGAVLVLRDMSQLRHQEQQITYLASHDPLTGLRNRRQFEKALEEILQEPPTASRKDMVFYLDLDQFKVINDSCGHLAGDEMLKQVTSVLLAKVRASDLLARLGGDEFAVVLRDCPFDKALEIADSMREAVKDFRFTWEGRIFQIGVSIGVVPVGPDVSREQLLRAADAACYVAKEKGRNRIQIFQPDDVDVASRFGEMQWIPRLQGALQENRFCLYWQPVRCLQGEGTGRLRGEILLRMREEDETELLLPEAFLPAAERYRLMPALDRWVLKATLRQLAQEPLPEGATLAVNLSGQALAEGAFEDFVLKVLRGSSVPPSALCFELSEATVMANLASAQHFITTVKKVGCRLSLDDFGSGLTSFSYLRTLPVDYLKIHGELVRRLDADPVARVIVESAHRIGHELGMKTVGKAVESTKISQALTELGVDYGQGLSIASVRPFGPGCFHELDDGEVR